ncbi:tripartite tricarboxylate transporter TctB family protein [Roseibium sp. SCP14]|uniref:tripartite tricarboxylate transporter TctB family protein n=1 Tax=Roseibium sp. SCP14 TaxID=3141375 RepID=UPI00333D92C9
MAHIKTLQELFRRYRRPGDIVFAILFLAFSLFLLSQLYSETAWIKRTNWYAQPRFWPAVSLIGMAIFACLHFIGSICSPRILGRWKEVAFWVSSLEFVLYFLGYVVLVPQLGYLPSTVLFTVFLTLRIGETRIVNLLSAVGFAVAVAVVFRAFLQVKIPAGRIYEALPDGIRAFALTYL